jgi:DNA-directed RNA polymerase subunit beta
LDIRVLREDQTEVEIKESVDDIDDLNVNIDGFDKEDDTSNEFFRRPTATASEETELVDFLFDGEEGTDAATEVEKTSDSTDDSVDDLIDEEVDGQNLDDEE